MDKNRAEHQARLLIAANGLDPNLFKWNRGKSMMGQMHAVKNRYTGEIIIQSISLSSYWVEAMTEDEVREVMLHEVAHALMPGDNHGWRFKAKVRELGGSATHGCYAPSAETKARMQQLAPAPWVGTCRKGHESRQHRAPLRVRSCRKCSGSFKIENVLVWKKNGRTVAMPAKYTKELNLLKMRHQASNVWAALKL